jgi:hypothetical protein
MEARTGRRGRRRQRAHGLQVAALLRPRGRGGPARPLLGTALGRQPHARGPDRGDRLPAPTAPDRRRDRRAARDAGLDRLSALEPREPANRYEKARPGELVHVDVKKLGKIGRPGHRVNGDRRTRSRGVGWEFVHVCIDDATRLAYAEVLADEKGTTAVGFLRRALAFFAS